MDANSGPQPMACWSCKGPDVPRLIAEWAKPAISVANGQEAVPK